MNSIIIKQFFTSPLPIKLIMSAGMAFVFLYVKKRDTEGLSTGFLYLFGLQALRDILYALLPAPEIYLLSDMFILTAMAYFVASALGSRGFIYAVTAVNVAVAALFVADFSLTFLPAMRPSLFAFLPLADALAIVVFLAVRSGFADRRAMRAWYAAAAFGALYGGASLLLGYEDAVFHRFAVPLFYCWPLTVALLRLETHEKQLVNALEYYEGAVDSIYNLSVQTSSAIKDTFSMSDMLSGMMRAVAEETGADGGAVLLMDDFEDALTVRSVFGNFPPPFKLPDDLPRKPDRVNAFVRHAQFKLGETLLGEVARTGRQVLILRGEEDQRVPSNGGEEFLRVGSLMIVPLVVEDTVIGVLALERLRGNEPFSESQFDHCKTLANFGALQISNFFSFLEARERSERERAANIAAEIQSLIVPKKLPEYPTVALGAFTAPAIGVSGDYFDVIQTRKDRVLLAVGDVAGKGVAAALVMVMVRSILHLVANTDKDVSTMLSWINRGITGKIDMDHYATLGLVAVDLTTGEVEYSNASHQPLLIFRAAEDGIESVELKSIPIGVERDTMYGKKTFRLQDGDILLMYTDGVVESMNGQGRQFGRKNLGTSLLKSRSLQARDVATRIRSDLANFVGDTRQHDDQTVLVMKMKF